jgi:pimeloyl-ACP methyl ester carboxylesterase
MHRHLALSLLALAPLAGCLDSDSDATATSTTAQDVSLGFHREHVTADIYHYTVTVPVGRTANAAIRVHRMVRELAPFVPRPTAHAAMLLHGDFATFDTSFTPGLAPYLAAHDTDVWGVDRRWTLATDDISDFGSMSVAQELGDLRTALVLARATRSADGSGTGKLALVGFSHGAQLAYTYAAADGSQMSALAALDFFGTYSPDDADLQAASCDNSAFEYQLVADGSTDSPNDFFIQAGMLDRTAPNDASPFIPDITNRDFVLLLLGQTYRLAPITPDYRLLQLNADGTAFAHVAEATADRWIEDAPPHQSMLEAADLDAQLCGNGPIAAPLSNIHVPLLYLGAAGGVGARGLYTTTRVASTDVTTRVVPNYGHADLLFANTAPQLAWQPLATWLAHH